MDMPSPARILPWNDGFQPVMTVRIGKLMPTQPIPVVVILAVIIGLPKIE
jgi:hypothetical protein